MKDVRDGKWHGWKSKLRPKTVARLDIVDVMLSSGRIIEGEEAKEWTWENVASFRVVPIEELEN